MIVPFVVIANFGGFDALFSGLREASPALLAPTQEVSLGESGGWTSGASLGTIGIVSGLAWGLGYFGQPHILARFMGIRSASAVPKARRIAVIWAFTALAASVFIGMIGIVYFENQLGNPETVFVNIVQGALNPWIGGILLAAVLAAIMSTADSQLLVASSALSEDFYRAFLHREASDATLLWVGRITVIGVAIAAYIMALGGGSVLDLVAYAWAGFGAAFGPLIIMSLFWKQMNWVGALAGLIGGAVTVVAWKQIDPFGWGLYEIVPGFIVGFVFIFAFNILGPSPSEQMEEDFAVVNGNAESGA